MRVAPLKRKINPGSSFCITKSSPRYDICRHPEELRLTRLQTILIISRSRYSENVTSLGIRDTQHNSEFGLVISECGFTYRSWYHVSLRNFIWFESPLLCTWLWLEWLDSCYLQVWVFTNRDTQHNSTFGFSYLRVWVHISVITLCVLSKLLNDHVVT